MKMDSLTKQKVTFTVEEKELLVSLLKHEKIIEDRKTNKATNYLKAQAWDRITQKYNMNAFVTKRETMQLRRCWEKIKRCAKDGRTKEIRNRLATGGGSPPPPVVDSVPGVDEVVPHLMYEIPSTIDSNTIFEKERKAILTVPGPPASIPDISMMEADRESEMPNSMAASNLGIMQRDQERCLREPQLPSPLLGLQDQSGSVQERCLGEQQLPSPLSGLQNRSASVRRRLAPTTASDVISMRQMNILKEREQQEELYLLRRSILSVEKEIACENLRHVKEENKIKEILEAEKLEYLRALWKIELELASNKTTTNKK